MANKNYTYPRVSISTTAKNHSSIQPAAEDTTVMFVPITTEKGPSQEIVRVHSLSEFIETFGNLSYERNGQMALNLYNWLNNGGTAYVYRLTGINNETKASITDKSTDIFAKEYTNVATGVSFVDGFKADDIEGIENTTYFIDRTNSQLVYVSVTAKNAPVTVKTYDRAPSDFKKSDMTADKDYYFISDVNKSLGIADDNTEIDKLAGRQGLWICSQGAKPNTSTLLRYFAKNTNPDSGNEIGKAKYFGEYYNNLELNVKLTNVRGSNRSFSIDLILRNDNSATIVERFPRLTLKNYKSAIVSSEYIDSNFDTNNVLKTWIESANEGDETTYYFGEASDNITTGTTKYDHELALLKKFWVPSEGSPIYNDIISNTIEYPIDIIFDAGYPSEIKKAMMSFINNLNESSTRPDIVGIFDIYELKKNEITKDTGYLNIPDEVALAEFENQDTNFDYSQATNIALYEQYFMISDEIFTGQNIYVTPSYFLTRLIAYNDMTYGIQFPTAGTRRGVLVDALYVNNNPNADTKESLFKDRINYVEKSPREYAFMNQRTHDGSSADEYTALSFLNNVRVVEKMKKELERLGRNYLFEFNDSITLAQLSDVLNKYVMNWISNRTLATGVVTVEKNPWSDEAVDINLTIRFNGTIEVISVQITIE